MPFTLASDHDLVIALRKGSREAMTEIFGRYWQGLYLAATHKLKSHALAEEIVQDLFTDLWQKREHLLPNSEVKLAAYLHRAVKNRVLNEVRKQVYDKMYWEYCRRYLPVSETSTQNRVEYNDLREKLDTALDQLPGKTKKIFVLHKIEGLPVVKISEQLNLSEKAVGYHLTKSTKELRTHLRDFM